MNMVVCDDDRTFVKIFEDAIKVIMEEKGINCSVFCYDNPVKMLEQTTVQPNTVFFLDIDMPQLTGFEAADTLRKRLGKFDVVFVTNREELVFQSFEYSPIAFIRKRYFRKELSQLLNRLFSGYRLQDTVIEVLEQRGKNRVLHNVPLRDILYIDNEKNYVKIITSNAEYSRRSTLNQMEKQLSPFGFIRVHAGFLVNYQYIESFEREYLRLTNRAMIPLSRSKREKACESWYRLLGGMI